MPALRFLHDLRFCKYHEAVSGFKSQEYMKLKKSKLT